jgi:hypothetical protein
MRIRGWMNERKIATVQLEKTCTKITASPSMSPFFTDVVTATAGHKLSANRNIGFSGINPFHSSFIYLFNFYLR